MNDAFKDLEIKEIQKLFSLFLKENGDFCKFMPHKNIFFNLMPLNHISDVGLSGYISRLSILYFKIFNNIPKTDIISRLKNSQKWRIFLLRKKKNELAKLIGCDEELFKMHLMKNIEVNYHDVEINELIEKTINNMENLIYKNSILAKVEEMINEQMHNISEAINVEDNNKKATAEELLKTLKLIKAALIKANDKKEYTLEEQGEIKTLIEMVEQRNKSIAEYKKGGRNDLVKEEENEINLIMGIAPKVKEHFDSMPKDEDIENYARECLNTYIVEKGEDYTLSMKDMGALVKSVKNKYPNANGNIIKNVLQEAIG